MLGGNFGSRLSCGSLSPIPPKCFPCKPVDRNIKIIITDSLNNNDSVFSDLNEDVAEGNGPPLKAPVASPRTSAVATATTFHTASSRLNDSVRPLSRATAVLIYASLSSLVLSTCVGLAWALTSLSVGVTMSVMGGFVLVLVILFSYRMYHQQARRSGYQRLRGADCVCSPSMSNIFHQCSHEGDTVNISDY